MKLKVSAKAETVLKLPENVSFTFSSLPYQFLLTKGGDGFLSEVAVVTSVVDYASFLPSFKIDQAPTISVPANPYLNDAVDLLRYLESMGGFWMGIKKIHWSEARLEWIPESDQERSQLSVLAVSQRLNFERSPAHFRAEILQDIILKRGRNQHLTIPMAHIREALNEYYEMRFVEAFINLYFFLEYVYGEGNTKNRLIVKSFLRSSQLRGTIERVLDELSQPDMSRHRGRLEAMLKNERLPLSVDGIVEHIVKTRGQLHHSVKGSTRDQRNPMNQWEHETTAYVLLQICMRTVSMIFSGQG